MLLIRQGPTTEWWLAMWNLFGKVGLGFSFNGSGYIRIPDSLSLHMSNELTIELWYKSEGGPAAKLLENAMSRTARLTMKFFLSPSLGITVQF